ncbi:hypothetical protein FAEPRAA2165_00032 [Faecalibacterium duncaniae]|uniref:Uncharacterized protein n=1 Tax=Faecalibacterium duncaniae (strain DSM 17677 / JCM 31915 / A2-165) TaxID=411483 RepID=C7H194_FAED2|nr:hypothetical protein FAEPRAA2165_00032 [Faecalibacterium duncaniae]
MQAASTFPRISCGKITNFYGNCTQKADRHTPTGFFIGIDFLDQPSIS